MNPVPRLTAVVPICGKNSDLWYHAVRRRIYATGIDGIAVYDQRDPDHYTPITAVANSPGAATSLALGAMLNRLFVSAPTTGVLSISATVTSLVK